MVFHEITSCSGISADTPLVSCTCPFWASWHSATRHSFQIQALILANRPEFETFCLLLRILGLGHENFSMSKLAGDAVVTFGKHKGQLLSSLPENYLLWMTRELEPKWKSLATAVLQERHALGASEQAPASGIVVPFGKYKGQLLDSLPVSQLEWMAKEMYSHWGRLAKEVLDKRKSGSCGQEIMVSRQGTNIEVDSLKQLIKSCGDAKNLREAKQIHAMVIESPHSRDRYIANLLVEMYGKCGSVDDARKTFNAISWPNVFSWNIMLKTYTQNGHLEEAHNLFKRMTDRSLVSWNIMLGGFAEKGHLHEAKRLFDEMPDKDVVSWTTMLTVYINNRQLQEARSMFDGIREHNVVTWNTMIHGYARYGYVDEAKSMFDRMPHEKTLISWNVMIDAYGQNGRVEEARRLFDATPDKNQVTWNTMLAAYAKSGHLEGARRIFNEMPDRDDVSWTSMIQAYCQEGDLEGAKIVFDRMPFPKTMVQWTVMLEAYSKSGDVERARETFDSMPKPDVTAWNAIIAAYAQNGYLREANAMFHKATQLDMVSWNIMISAYASSGYCEEAKAIFDKMQQRDVFSWTALITGYVQNDLPKHALEVYHNMLLEGVGPNRVTFIGILSATGQACELEESRQLFTSINMDYGISPSIEHYDCVIGILGRAKLMNDAKELVSKMPFVPDAQAWMTLLVASKIHGDVEHGEYAAKQILELDPKNAAPYILLAEIYSQAGRHKDISTLEKEIRYRGIKRVGGCSSIEVGNKMHKFYVGDKSHPRNQEIQGELVRLSKLIKVAGYVAKVKDLKWNDDNENGYHSEKLAIAFGLISNCYSLRLINNLRMCCDCHNFAKYVSKIAGLKIVVRDVHHVHHFEGGVCSCGNTW